jgi:D-glycero-alpha-D-manno-heptose-7-phosphate kinase
VIISKTPLRISFAGGGSDLPSYYKVNAGKVISTSIDKYVYVIVKKRFDEMIYINYSKKEIVKNVNDIQHSLVRESLKEVGITSGIEITTLSDIPSAGSGLGSSSAITVGLLNAFYNYKNILISKEDLAKKACEIEIKKCNNPIGKQDQYGCSLGGLNKIIFNKDESVFVNKIDFNPDKLEKNLYLCYTGITRKANNILKRQSENSILKSTENKKLINGVDKLEQHLLQNELCEIGPFLDNMWKIKKNMASGISNSSIEKLYNKGLKSGSVGGKILGAGGGGFILFYVPRKNQENFEKKMNKYEFLNFKFEKHGTKIVFVES